MNNKQKKETSWLVLLTVFLLFFITNTAFLAFFFITLTPARQDAVELYIPPGVSLHRISDMLVERGVIMNRRSFELICKLRGLDKGLRAGDYTIPPGLNPYQVISVLTTGRGEMVRVTVPEGLTDKQVLDRLAAAVENLDLETLAYLAQGDSLPGALGLETRRLTGYLFPETYFVPPTMDEAGMLSLMVKRFNRVWSELTRGEPPLTGLGRHETVILASIIEKEAVAADERPIISSVFLNRLELDRPLESCATVLFVLGKHKSRLLYRDLEVDSPYNTYLHRGLPPGPISNPGRASLEAALYPSDTRYLYFVSRGDGTHIFSRSLRDHNRARRLVKR
ncbi:MAG: endolytic transglycosylase MltG [Gemmatimonadota bacterium]|nr:endolytic transglycosylase MltG [Gemmatimonadota bacterium]